MKQFGIIPRITFVDYGCGPGRYLEMAASLVGEAGLIYGEDISDIAIKHVKRRIAAAGLNIVVPVLLEPGNSTIPEGCADVVYSIDMFHHIDDPAPFLENIRRVIKKGCLFYL